MQTPSHLLETQNARQSAPSIPGGSVAEGEERLGDSRDPGGAALTMVSLGSGSHAESG